MHPLEPLFNPRSIAVIGASTASYKPGYQVLCSLKDFKGDLYPVNPKADSILGLKAYPDLASVPVRVDLAVLTIPAAACREALENAGKAGAASALIISGGFAESDDIGSKTQAELSEICKKYNIRLLGPNTAGFANMQSGVLANFMSWITEISTGNIGLVSQSGAMIFAIAAFIDRRKLGFSLATGIGNGADVDVAEAVDYLRQHDGTKVIIVYIEGVKDGRRLFEVVRKTTPHKPVVVLTVGKGNIADFAASHTGNLIGSYRLKCAALEQAGAILVDSCEALIDAAQVLSTIRLSPDSDPGVGILTGQAGPAMLITDYLMDRQTNIPKLGEATSQKIRELLPAISYIKNPVDTTRPGKSFPEIMAAMANDPIIKLLITFLVYEPAAIDPVDTCKGVIDRLESPLLFATAGPEPRVNPTISSLQAAGINSFPSPERAARAAYALVSDARAAYHIQNLPAVSRFDFSVDLLERYDEAQAKDLLTRIGIPTVNHQVCSTREQAMAIFSGFSRPCVLKILDAKIQHKTEVGGVVLNLATETEFKEALDRLDRIASGNARYLIEEMALPGLDIILGAKNDPSFGPTVLLGLGGTVAEALADVSIRLAPLTEPEAMAMIDELKSAELFNGWRGGPKLDKEGIVQAIIRLGALISEFPQIGEIDINPVRVYPDRILALDALIDK